MEKMTAASHVVMPSLAWLGMDHEALPEGDGHPVIIVPGLTLDRRSLKPLSDCCEALGYAVYDWEQGFNTGPEDDVDGWLENLATHVRGVAALHNRRVSLVGSRLGGLYAREIAKLHPALVRQVIMLGTPFFEVEGNHIGLPWNPQALQIVAERLALSEVSAAM